MHTCKTCNILEYNTDFISMSILINKMVIVAGIGHGDTSSNPGLITFHIALIPLGKV